MSWAFWANPSVHGLAQSEIIKHFLIFVNVPADRSVQLANFENQNKTSPTGSHETTLFLEELLAFHRPWEKAKYFFILILFLVA